MRPAMSEGPPPGATGASSELSHAGIRMPRKHIDILLVEDDDRDAASLEALLGEDGRDWFALRRASRLSDALRQFSEETFDVVLLDLNLPDSRGVSTVSQVREMALMTPIVVLGDTNDEVLKNQAIENGAQEYLIKGKTGETGDTFVRAMRYAIEIKNMEERLRHMSRYDSMTNVVNRPFLYDRLQLALARARRYDRILAVLILDLDHFKTINDTLGHTIGDRLLKRVAERLTGCLRANDTVARLGGDEFSVLLSELTEPDDVAKVVDKFMSEFRKPSLIDDHELFVSVSIGSSVYPSDGDDAETLLKNADSALQRAKQLGRNNHQFYSPVMNAKASRNLQMGNALRRAVEREEFFLVYQPQVDMESERLVGVEALIRWKHPGWGIVQPIEFIQLAEETGLIFPIGDWVLKSACAQARAWQDAGLPRLRVGVNLSNRQFNQKNLVKTVTRVLEEERLDPGFLELELTESTFMHNEEDALATLGALKEMGVHIAIDDFGTGYSSLRYLKRFPIDILKIDRSFVQDIPGDAEDAAIVEAIIAMAKSLDVCVIAEGVETLEQLTFLRAHGCNLMQGYYFSRPINVKEMTRRLGEDERWRPEGAA